MYTKVSFKRYSVRISPWTGNFDSYIAAILHLNILLHSYTLYSVFNVKFFFLNLHSGGWNEGPLDTAAT
jgi:hypothetical protein